MKTPLSKRTARFLDTAKRYTMIKAADNARIGPRDNDATHPQTPASTATFGIQRNLRLSHPHSTIKGVTMAKNVPSVSAPPKLPAARR